MDFNTLKECIHIEVVGNDQPFSWRKALTRSQRHGQKRFLFWWRIGSYLYSKGGRYRKIAKRIERNLHKNYNIVLPIDIDIGKGLTLVYLSGIIVGRNCIIGENLRIQQGVTIGMRTDTDNHITIGNNVTIGCNASILGGNIKIGDNVIIGAHALVMTSVPDNSTYINKISAEIRPRK